MNSFSYFVLYLTVTLQAECKRYHETGEIDDFRRLYQQIRPPQTLPTQIPWLFKITKPIANFEVFKNKFKASLPADEAKGLAKVNTAVKKQELAKETQRASEVLKNTKKLPQTSKVQRERKKGLRSAKQLTTKPKEFNEEQKKAIRARYYQRERDDVLDLERQKVEELKQKVKMLRTSLKSSKKNSTKRISRMNSHQGLQRHMGSNQESSDRRNSAKHMTKKQSSAATTAATKKHRKSRFFVQTNAENTTGTSETSRKGKKSSDLSSDSDDEPVMRGVDKDFDDDDDEELNFDVEGELLTDIVQ